MCASFKLTFVSLNIKFHFSVFGSTDMLFGSNIEFNWKWSQFWMKHVLFFFSKRCSTFTGSFSLHFPFINDIMNYINQNNTQWNNEFSKEIWSMCLPCRFNKPYTIWSCPYGTSKSFIIWTKFAIHLMEYQVKPITQILHREIVELGKR